MIGQSSLSIQDIIGQSFLGGPGYMSIVFMWPRIQ